MSGFKFSETVGLRCVEKMIYSALFFPVGFEVVGQNDLEKFFSQNIGPTHSEKRFTERVHTCNLTRLISTQQNAAVTSPGRKPGPLRLCMSVLPGMRMLRVDGIAPDCRGNGFLWHSGLPLLSVCCPGIQTSNGVSRRNKPFDIEPLFLPTR